MNRSLLRLSFASVAMAFLLSACSTAKIEARLAANPQCRDIVNPKTGALMPCPESDKAFYQSVGLAPAPAAAAPVAAVTSVAPLIEANSAASSAINSKPLATPTAATPKQNDCKPQIHKKTGGILPCPATD